MPAYPGFGSFFSHSGSDSSMSSFEEVFYHRPSSEAEYLTIKHSEKEKLDAEKVKHSRSKCFQEILKHVRVTDYQSCLDTLTVSEELVADADYFFRLMSYATNNQAFSLNCQFETKQ